jgi:hypothetical protein
MAAHPAYTWTTLRTNIIAVAQNAEPETNQYIDWLQDPDMLPAVVPEARIMRFGYRSDGWGEKGLKTKASGIAHMLLHDLTEERKGEVRNFSVKVILQDRLMITRNRIAP